MNCSTCSNLNVNLSDLSLSCDKEKECGGQFYKPIIMETGLLNKKEMINHPSHYNQGKFEAIDVIEDWQLNFNLGNTVKYISRAGHKDDIIQDLKKALWYLDREIKRLEKGE